MAQEKASANSALASKLDALIGDASLFGGGRELMAVRV